MKTIAVLILICVASLSGCAFFFYQSSQFAAEARAYEQQRDEASRQMNLEEERGGQAYEAKRWEWLELGDYYARASFSAVKNRYAGIACLIFGVVTGLVGVMRWRRRASNQATNSAG